MSSSDKYFSIPILGSINLPVLDLLPSIAHAKCDFFLTNQLIKYFNTAL